MSNKLKIDKGNNLNNLKELNKYDFPNDLHKMSVEELYVLGDEIRDFLINSLSVTGGHVASNLGVVELTIALFKVFDFDKDKLVWDVGHQSYIHKILTGRASEFDSLRQLGGLSGFPKMDESKFDHFDTGHSSNSISVIGGMAAGRDILGDNYNVIGVIGDGSLTGGMAYEGLNNLGELKKKSIIILNDNGMSIGENTGSVNNHLSKLRTSKGYTRFKHRLRDKLVKIPAVGGSIYRGLDKFKDTIKAGLVKGILFEELGFTYLGPIDGHDIEKLVKNLEFAADSQEPCVIHISTTKGKGYKPAEDNPDLFHGTGPFDVKTGLPSKTAKDKTYSDVFGEKLVDMAITNKKIVAVSAAMIDGTGLSGFKKVFPNRTFDVGIAEQHAIAFAGGMAMEGITPFVALYSSFLQRAYDQVIMDVALQNAPVVICIDRAGCVGADGETHHGIYDLSFLNHIPNLVVFTPATKEGLENAMEEAVTLNKPVAIRYPRGKAIKFEELEKQIESIESEKNEDDEKVAILAVGTMYSKALEAAILLKEQGVQVKVNLVDRIRPFDTKSLDDLDGVKLVVTVEDNMIVGGYGQQVGSYLMEKLFSGKVINLGWTREFIEHGTQDELMRLFKIDGQGISERIVEELNN